MLIKRIVNFFKKDNNLILGRWSSIKEADVFKRVDLANNDHCGSCHFMDIQKDKSTKSKKKDSLSEPIKTFY